MEKIVREETSAVAVRGAFTGQSYPLNVQSFPSFLLLVDYGCFRLTSGASTAVGLYIVHRSRKRFLLSQSTLREEFVEKKYQVFDIISLPIILVHVDPSSLVEQVSMSWNFEVSTPPQHRCGVCL